MQIKLSCQDCGQGIEITSETIPSEVQCPTCGSTVKIPGVAASEQTPVPPLAEPVPPIAVATPVYVAAPPQKQRSIGWGVFLGLFGFFIVLPTVVIGGLLFLGVFGSAVQRAQQRSERIRVEQTGSDQPSATNGGTSGVAAKGATKSPKTLATLKLGKEFKVERDEIRNLTFIQRADSPELQTSCYLYISDKGDGNPTLFMRCQYFGEDRFFFTSLMFRASDKTWKIKNVSYSQMDHERIDRKFFGTRDILVSSGDNQDAVRAMLSEPKLTTLRLDSESQNTYEDFKVSSEQLDGMRAVFDVWAALKGI